jgi:hypothetical protein
MSRFRMHQRGCGGASLPQRRLACALCSMIVCVMYGNGTNGGTNVVGAARRSELALRRNRERFDRPCLDKNLAELNCTTMVRSCFDPPRTFNP